MTLTAFFLAVNAAGVRLVNVNGHLQLRGPDGSITPEIRAGAAEHKAAILAMLPPSALCDDAREQAEEHAAIKSADATGATGLAAALAGWDETVRGDGWGDWQLEWQMEVGLLCLRMRDCADEAVLAKLKPLADAKPTTLADWLELGRCIRNTEGELRQAGSLPVPYWPPKARPAS